MIDPNKFSGQKRSSLKSKNIFPENMTVEQFIAMQQNKKNLKWDTNVTELHISEEIAPNKNSDATVENTEIHDSKNSTEKYKDAKTHFVDLVILRK